MKHRLSATKEQPSKPSIRGIFGFETDFAGTLRCIPMSVRLKLDQVGIKLSLKQWNRIAAHERQQLIDRPCGSDPESASFKEYLVRLIETQARSEVEYTAVEESPVWADPQAMPTRIAAWAEDAGVPPPSADQWAALTPLQRFTLFKLTRPGHSNENFIPAMREFSILP